MTKYIASVSFGKDSLAMLLLIIEKNLPLDEVVFYDTGMEFQAIYNIRDKVVKLLQEKGIKYTELKPENPFEWTMFEKPVNGRKNGFHYGYSWCGGRCRWGTTEKLKTIDQYCGNAKQYVGIAADESKRLKTAWKNRKKTPLFDYDMTEQDCLDYCRERGFDWLEGDVNLYDILDRVSCWCCANKNLKELRNYKKYLPEYWERLKDLQRKTDRPFKGDKTIFDLDKKFSEVKDEI